jgi:hypothetical protein
MLKTLSKFAPVIVVQFAFIGTEAIAHSPAHHGRGRTAEPAIVHAHSLARHRHHLVRRELPSRQGSYGRPADGVRPYFGPGYVFVPGRGILDEACNLPTSTCPNEVRDIR